MSAEQIVPLRMYSSRMRRGNALRSLKMIPGWRRGEKGGGRMRGQEAMLGSAGRPGLTRTPRPTCQPSASPMSTTGYYISDDFQ